MSGMTAQANEAIHAVYDFAGINTIIDVGGGHGGLITGILKKNPSMRGILFDAPEVIEGAKSVDAKVGRRRSLPTCRRRFLQSCS